MFVQNIWPTAIANILQPMKIYHPPWAVVAITKSTATAVQHPEHCARTLQPASAIFQLPSPKLFSLQKLEPSPEGFLHRSSSWDRHRLGQRQVAIVVEPEML